MDLEAPFRGPKASDCSGCSGSLDLWTSSFYSEDLWIVYLTELSFWISGIVRLPLNLSRLQICRYLNVFNRSMNLLFTIATANILDWISCYLLDLDRGILLLFDRVNPQIPDSSFMYFRSLRMDPSQNRLIYHKFCSQLSTNHFSHVTSRSASYTIQFNRKIQL